MSEEIQNQARIEVTSPSEPDSLAQALIGEVDNLSNVEFVIQTDTISNELIITAQGQNGSANCSAIVAPPTQPPPISPTQQASLPEMGPDTISAMKTELLTAHSTISALNGETARLRTKCLQMENSLGTGMPYNILIFLFIHHSSDRGQLVTELQASIASSIATGFQTLELSFADKVARELRAELHRLNFC